jgi:hypothetical protein
MGIDAFSCYECGTIQLALRDSDQYLYECNKCNTILCESCGYRIRKIYPDCKVKNHKKSVLYHPFHRELNFCYRCMPEHRIKKITQQMKKLNDELITLQLNKIQQR